MHTGSGTGTSGINWLFGDHLGSQSITTDENGNKYNPPVEVRYKAWGADRYTSGTTPTSFRFTGQRSEMESLGLYFYGSRWYDPYITRFTQPDPIIPDPYNPLDWDRYAYVNPIRFIDPSGHDKCTGSRDVWKPDCGIQQDPYIINRWVVPDPSDPDAWWYQKNAAMFLLGGMKPPLRTDDPDYRGFGDNRKQDLSVIDKRQGHDRYHMAIDAAHAPGLAVFPIVPGIVVKIGYSKHLGNYIIIEHDVYGKKFYSVYAHLGKSDTDTGILVSKGEIVDVDTQIGATGNTKGESPGSASEQERQSHLHFEVRTPANVNLAAADPFAQLYFWGYKDFPWEDYFLDLGLVFGYDSDWNP